MANCFPSVVLRIKEAPHLEGGGRDWSIPPDINFRMVLVSGLLLLNHCSWLVATPVLAVCPVLLLGGCSRWWNTLPLVGELSLVRGRRRDCVSRCSFCASNYQSMLLCKLACVCTEWKFEQARLLNSLVDPQWKLIRTSSRLLFLIWGQKNVCTEYSLSWLCERFMLFYYL